MFKLKKFKFYTHHKQFLPLKIGEKGKNWFLIILIRVANWIFSGFYFIGLVVLSSIQFLFKNFISGSIKIRNMLFKFFVELVVKIKNDAIKSKRLVKERINLFKQKNFAKNLSLFFVVAFLVCLSLAALGVGAKLLKIKAQATSSAELGNSYLQKAQGSLTAQDFVSAQNQFVLAEQQFTKSQNLLKETGQTLNTLVSILPQKQAADNLLKTALNISVAGQDLINLQNEASQLQISAAGINTNGNTAEILEQIAENLNQAKQKISLASQIVEKTDPSFLPQKNRADFTNLKDKLSAASLALNNFSKIFNLLKTLLSGDKRVLILFENNNELRATGGFMGTFGNLELTDGRIKKINVSSIYDLDGQLNEIIQPPLPVLKVNKIWYLRDSNWFADFPTSVNTILSFYQKEGGQAPDFVIAMTPNLIVDWLNITGPITLPKYGINLTSDNFIEQTQVISTISDNMPTNSPKQIFADLVPVLLQRISTLNKDSLPKILQSLQDNLNGKQIVFYSKDEQTQKNLEDFHWAGNILDTDRDYLSVVSANLSATKSDLRVSQKISLTSTVQQDGTINNELQITRTNNLPVLKGTENESFIRVYVPLGSKLISNEGFDKKNLVYPPDYNYKIDPDVYNWEKNSVTDNLTGTTIGVESGKTFFGNWLLLNGKESRTIKLLYQLPFKIQDLDRYSLLVQKQIGAANGDFDFSINFPQRQLIWKNFEPQKQSTNSLNSAIILSKDYLFGMVLQKR